MSKGWGIIALVVAALYWLQAVLIPMALAVLLTFLLSPVVDRLQRWRLGRVPAVLVTVVLALTILGGMGWTLTRQLVTLTDELPRYQTNIQAKIADLRGARKGGSWRGSARCGDFVGDSEATRRVARKGRSPCPGNPSYRTCRCYKRCERGGREVLAILMLRAPELRER